MSCYIRLGSLTVLERGLREGLPNWFMLSATEIIRVSASSICAPFPDILFPDRLVDTC